MQQEMIVDKAVSQIATVIIFPDATVSVSPVSERSLYWGKRFTDQDFDRRIQFSQYTMANQQWRLGGYSRADRGNLCAFNGSIRNDTIQGRIIDPNSGCSEPFSNIATVIVQPNAVVNITLNNAEVCIDGDATLTATITGGSSS
jgi:hypothetical protein